jgi:hypothetical protein
MEGAAWWRELRTGTWPSTSLRILADLFSPRSTDHVELGRRWRPHVSSSLQGHERFDRRVSVDRELNAGVPFTILLTAIRDALTIWPLLLLSHEHICAGSRVAPTRLDRETKRATKEQRTT